MSRASTRVERYEKKYTVDTTVIRLKRHLPRMALDLEFEIDWNMKLEDMVYIVLEALGVDPALWELYRAWFYRKAEILKRFNGVQASAEVALLNSEFILRGLATNTLALLEPYVDAWAEGYREGELRGFNRVLNSGFELDLDRWTVEAGYPVIRTDEYHTGLKCMASAFSAGKYQPYTVSQPIPLVPSENVIECYVWRKYGTFYEDLLRLYYTDGSYSEILLGQLYQWEKVSITPTAGKIINKLMLKRLTAMATICCLDDVSLIVSI